MAQTNLQRLCPSGVLRLDRLQAGNFIAPAPVRTQSSIPVEGLKFGDDVRQMRVAFDFDAYNRHSSAAAHTM